MARRPHDDGERLADLLGRSLLRDAANPALDDERYEAWLADELAGAGARAERRVSDATYVARGRALLAAVRARRLGVACRAGVPTYRAPAERGTPGAVLAHAASLRAAPLVDLAVAAGAGRELWDEPCERWVDVPDDLPDGRYLALRVRGDSMVPLMRGGDTVLVRVESRVDAVQAGSVIVARHPDDGYVCKRVRRVVGRRIELDSLAPDGPSLTVPRDGRHVLGTVLMVWRANR